MANSKLANKNQEEEEERDRELCMCRMGNDRKIQQREK
jgi:hypothetical protein